MTSAANASHVGSCLSVVDILATLYVSVAKISPSSINSPDRDRIILSKGHSAAALYAVLAELKFFDKAELATYSQNGARLGGHVTATVPGVELSTGSLGHGLPYGIGLAISQRALNSSACVYVVLSDGELDEGTTWESALIANHLKLKNLKVVVDRNRLQSLKSTEETIQLEPLGDKFRSFGWNVATCDGHNHMQIAKALEADGPLILIAETTKGKGVDFMENSVPWHYKSASVEQLNQALEQLPEIFE
jgi:transketolase